MKDDPNTIVVVGSVTESLPNATFRIELDDDHKIMLAYLSGKMRKFRIKIVIGDRVEVVTDVSREKGRITRRL